MTFFYCSSRTGIPFNCPLWRLKTERRDEWKEIVSRVTSIDNEKTLSEALLKNKDVKSLIECCHRESSTIEDLVNLFADKSQKTYGWFTAIFLDIVGGKHPIISFLSDLHSVYQPIVLIKDISDGTTVLPLGSNIDVEVEAKGSPQAHYQWLFMRIDDNVSLNKWEKVPLNSQCRVLSITNLQLADCGVYRCRMFHGIPVKTNEGQLKEDVLSQCIRIKPKEGSLNILEQPTDIQGTICGQAEFRVLAESTHPLHYEWYFEDAKVILSDSDIHEGRLILNNLHNEQSGSYKCRIYNEFENIESDSAKLIVHTPNLEDINVNTLVSDNEDILILKQPSFNTSRRVNKGDSISLEVIASCKYKLKYEWCKKGLKQDLIDTEQPQRATPLIPVCHGPQLVDEATSDFNGLEEFHPIGSWIYVCLITCPQTNEKILTDSVHISMSFCSSGPQSLPSFKIALIICQEDYKDPDFHELEAPKYDGLALIKALKEMDFEVISFINLSVIEIRNAVKLLRRFIDEMTYVLFYYNGHALGSGTDVYLTGLGSNLSGSLEEFIWHGEIELLIDSCRPLLCIFIYDSCRVDPPPLLRDKLRSMKHTVVPFKSSFVISYGTQPSMRSFEYYERSLGACQGLYMKYLLGHIQKKIRIEEVFIGLSDSFMRSEDTTVVTKMRPEVKVSTKQAFYLCAPLRSNRFNQVQSLFFQFCRFESYSHNPNAIMATEFKYVVGLAYDRAKETLVWVTGKSKKDIPLSYNVEILAKELGFMNEALLVVRCNKVGPESEGNLDSRYELQLSSSNVELISTTQNEQLHAPIAVLYAPCRFHSIGREGGPLFLLQGTREEEGNSECKMVNLQKVDGNAKIRLNLRAKDGTYLLPCNGVLEFPLPILRNFPFLQLNSKL